MLAPKLLSIKDYLFNQNISIGERVCESTYANLESLNNSFQSLNLGIKEISEIEKLQQHKNFSVAFLLFLCDKGTKLSEMNTVSLDTVDSILGELCSFFSFKNSLKYRKKMYLCWKILKYCINKMFNSKKMEHKITPTTHHSLSQIINVGKSVLNTNKSSDESLNSTNELMPQVINNKDSHFLLNNERNKEIQNSTNRSSKLHEEFLFNKNIEPKRFQCTTIIPSSSKLMSIGKSSSINKNFNIKAYCSTSENSTELNLSQCFTLGSNEKIYDLKKIQYKTKYNICEITQSHVISYRDCSLLLIMKKLSTEVFEAISPKKGVRFHASELANNSIIKQYTHPCVLNIKHVKYNLSNTTISFFCKFNACRKFKLILKLNEKLFVLKTSSYDCFHLGNIEQFQRNKCEEEKETLSLKTLGSIETQVLTPLYAKDIAKSLSTKLEGIQSLDNLPSESLKGIGDSQSVKNRIESIVQGISSPKSKRFTNGNNILSKYQIDKMSIENKIVLSNFKSNQLKNKCKKANLTQSHVSNFRECILILASQQIDLGQFEKILPKKGIKYEAFNLESNYILSQYIHPCVLSIRYIKYNIKSTYIFFFCKFNGCRKFKLILKLNEKMFTLMTSSYQFSHIGKIVKQLRGKKRQEIKKRLLVESAEIIRNEQILSWDNDSLKTGNLQTIFSKYTLKKARSEALAEKRSLNNKCNNVHLSELKEKEEDGMIHDNSSNNDNIWLFCCSCKHWINKNCTNISINETTWETLEFTCHLCNI